MVTKKPTTNLAVSVKTITQDNLPAMLKVIDEKIRQLEGGDEKDSPITEELQGFGKIGNITDLMTLRYAYALLQRKHETINSFNNIFQLASPTINVPEYKEQGHSVEKWLKAIVSQYKKVVFKEELGKLQKAKEKIQANLSAEEKLKADLQDVVSLLNIGK